MASQRLHMIRRYRYTNGRSYHLAVTRVVRVATLYISEVLSARERAHDGRSRRGATFPVVHPASQLCGGEHLGQLLLQVSSG